MIVSEESFELREGVEITGVEHLLCLICHEVTLTPEQSHALHEHMVRQRRMADGAEGK